MYNIRSTYTIDHMEILGDNPIPLPFNHLIWYETSGAMIWFIMLFIPKKLQSQPYYYYYFHTMSKWLKINFILKYVSKMFNISLIFLV